MKNQRILQFPFPVSDELLRNHDFFDLHPFDGGGCFINRGILGSSRDAAIAEKILAGALDDFGSFPELDYHRYAQWGTIERNCWLNRMYFAVPLAKQGAGELVMKAIAAFQKNCPPPEDEEAVERMVRQVTDDRNARDMGTLSDNVPTRYQWYDFQPASRIINTLNAARFISASEKQWEIFDAFIADNGRVLYVAETRFFQRERGNHQMLRALALMYAGIYLGIEIWSRLGAELCSWHIEHDFLPDGMLHEISPSYHLFETWLCRDAVLLAECGGLSISRDALARFGKACTVCGYLRNPDGFSCVLNDGYPLDMDVFLETLPPRRSEETDFLQDAGLAFIREDGIFALLDASPMPGKISHYHGGKNAVTLWFDGKPFIVDSGCCDYDNPAFREWYKKSEAHSSLLVDGFGDSRQLGSCGWEYGAETILSRSDLRTYTGKVSSPAWSGLVWTREMEKKGHSICLYESVSRKAGLEFVFVLHPDVNAEIAGKQVLLRNGDVSISVDTMPGIEWKLKSGWFCDGVREYDNLRLCGSTYGKKAFFQWKEI